MANDSLDLSFLDCEKIQQTIQQWRKWDTNAADVQELSQLVATKNVQTLKAYFTQRIEFGTAGLRGKMACGPANMNDLVVLQTTQGLAKYLETQDVNGKQKGIVIGYDGRHRSSDFARIVAAVFMSCGFRVYLFPRFVPTPFVPFGIMHHGATAGVMITASHNPKQDNGYKLYWGNGCQIISPHDINISASIRDNLQPWDIHAFRSDEFFQSGGNGLLIDSLEEVANAYFTAIRSPPYCRFPQHNSQSQFRITFTPMHGVGQHWVEKAFEAFRLHPFISVEEQKNPDPEFPTVTFPNPEEGKCALNLAMATANREGSSLIIANDPDADRCAVAERDPQSGEWRVFTGDDIGNILSAWIWSQAVAAQEVKGDLKDYFMVTTVVSSRMLQRIAEVEGFSFYETLTGFKFIGNKAIDMIRAGKHFLFAYEDAIGYLPGPLSFDKDGVRTAAMVAEMAIHLHEQRSLNLSGYLTSLYAKYGSFATENRYFFCYDPLLMKKIFDTFRTQNSGTYPSSVGRFQVKYIRDLTTGYDSQQPDFIPILPVSKSTQMITITFQEIHKDGYVFNGVGTIRGSGTEPKLKYYVEANSLPGGPDFAATKQVARDLAHEIIHHILRPQEYGLLPPAD